MGQEEVLDVAVVICLHYIAYSQPRREVRAVAQGRNLELGTETETMENNSCCGPQESCSEISGDRAED